MNIYQALAARRTIRDFAPQAVSREITERILEAGLRAPSHDHMRDWHFVIVNDPALRAELAGRFSGERTKAEIDKLLDGWKMTDACQRAMYLDGIPKQASMVLSAGLLVVPCFGQTTPVLAAKQSLHELNGLVSIWACIENILVAAASEGVQGVTKIISTPAEADHVRSVLGVPADYEIPCYLAMGYPAEDATWIEQIPVTLSERLHADTWDSSHRS